jgi:hypothetical protein
MVEGTRAQQAKTLATLKDTIAQHATMHVGRRPEPVGKFSF